MPKYSYYSVCLLFLLTGTLFGQKKSLQTQFTDEKITIDGKFDEPVWEKAAIATDFVMIAPDNGKPIPPERKTEVKILYSNEAIYVAAKLYDNQPDKISRELASRDSFATADHFGVELNGYNDGQQEFRFFVSAAGVQIDVLYTEANGEDMSWDAIWDSKTQITDFGWVVEMKIPYAALRFSTQKKQTWGLNFYREIRRDNYQYSWNLIDNKIKSESLQAGILNGIENIKTPTRLFLIPYSSYYLNANNNQKTIGEFKGGLDIKYGINDAFTLDAILIPDFGQTKFDNVELNLGPYQQLFNENRAFFTEGTDLFNKGGLLYSRRIGETPKITVADNETVVDRPTSIKLINALKISGRTKHGLGIGVLNAVSENTSVVVKNNDTGQTRLQTIAPLTNYNVFVLDQRFNKNSSIALINTNVTRNGDYRDANVSALEWDLNSKANSFQAQGNFEFSHVHDVVKKEGIRSYVEFNKTKGKIRFGAGANIITQDFDDNDLGVAFQTGFYNFYSNISYRILKPTKKINSFRINLNSYNEYHKETGFLKEGNYNTNFNLTTKKNIDYGLGININPFESYEFDPRIGVDGFSINPAKYGVWSYISTNYAKRFAFDFNPSYTLYNENGRHLFDISVSPRYRFNDHLLLIYSFEVFRYDNDNGYATSIDTDANPSTPDDVIFGYRNVVSYSNTLSGKYTLNNKMNLNLSVRHYWSYSENKKYLLLLPNGRFADYLSPVPNQDQDFSTWNLDLSYSWWFAPGSQITMLYRNNSSYFNDIIQKNYSENVKSLLNNEALNHVFSVSIKYYIDYNSIKNHNLSKTFTKPKERIHF
ncbi:carbohydrate binding family 9 domain-containing protein [Flavobacterium sp. N1994]|uniref:carbohydrate binding family 9 domain-containing protein n=1 Tax=Flavobacterium sp. N1994 TaxID=2986827 RepID=UPI0022224175|nr:carbohydrate binding family 9 domain-containing protein [Flavobacterium sp. N1994]